MNNLKNQDTREPRRNSQVQVINRAAAILRALRDSDGLTLSQLAKKVRLARTTAYRIVATLEAEGLVSTTSSGKIILGIELLALGAEVRVDVRHELRPYLEALSLQVDETVDLAILDGDKVLFLDQITRIRRLRAVSGIGLEFPLHCTANGKVLLSTLPDAEIIARLPEKLPMFTENTIPTREQLLKEIAVVRTTKIAYDREEHTLGICAVGAVVCAPLNTLAAVTIPVPSVRFYGNEEHLASALLATCNLINLRYTTNGYSLG